MKLNTINLFNVLLLSGLITACNSGNELENKKKDLDKAKSEMIALKQQITALESEISKLDTIQQKTEKGIPVEVLQLQKETFEHTVTVHGKVEASKNVLVNPEVAGTIISIPVKEGQRVSKGQTLAIIDASIIKNNIEEVKKSLEFVTTLFEKQKQLNEKGVGTEVQFLESKNKKESLEKTLQTLESQLEKYTVKASVSGFVDDIIPNIGEMANPQMPLARIVNLEKVFVETDLSEALLGKIKEADKVTVSFDNINKKVDGKIIQIGQYIDPNNRTFKVKIDLDEQNSLFKPNLLSIVEFVDYKSENAIVIPSNSIQDDLKGDFVFVVNGMIAEKKYIKIGKNNTEKTEVLEGFNGTEKIIIKGQRGLVHGEKVMVL